MIAADLHAAWRALPLIAPTAWTHGAPLVVLSPHPDDETLGTGGLIAAARGAGHAVHVVIVTDGAGSHPRSQSYPASRLVALRKRESATAATLIGLSPAEITHLDLPDTRAPTDGPDFDAAVARILSIVRETRARTLLATWRHDPHCDHEAVAAMARAVREAHPGTALWSYPIWGWHLPDGTVVDEGRPQGFRLDIAPWLPRKRAGIAAHASQMTDLIADDPDGFRFTEATLAPFVQPFETVFEVPA